MGKKYLDTKNNTLEASILGVWTEAAGLDPVNPKALKKGPVSARKDPDIDNDGDVDKSDEYLHQRRKTISKAIKTQAKKLPMAKVLSTKAKTLPMAKKIPLKAQYEESELKEKKITDMTREELKKLNKYSDEEIADILGDVEGAGEYKLQTGKSVRSKTFATGKHGAESPAKRISRYIKKAGHEDMSKVKDVKTARKTVDKEIKPEDNIKYGAARPDDVIGAKPEDKNLSMLDRVKAIQKYGEVRDKKGNLLNPKTAAAVLATNINRTGEPKDKTKYGASRPDSVIGAKPVKKEPKPDKTTKSSDTRSSDTRDTQTVIEPVKTTKSSDTQLPDEDDTYTVSYTHLTLPTKA